MKRLVYLILVAVLIWILWFSYVSKPYPIRTYDVIDSIKIQMPLR